MTNRSLYIIAKSDLMFLQEIGEFIRLERINQSMTQEDLALHAGISRKSISQFESGKVGISLLIFIQILRSLKLLDCLSVFKPIKVISPILLAKAIPKERIRVRKKVIPVGKKINKPKSDW